MGNPPPITIHAGDCLDVLRTMPDASVDAVVTDPPAGIAFMNRAWDTDKGGRDAWVAWLTAVMTEARRVLKPGGHALVWALPRTSHWTATALEDAGLEIRDCVVHLFGSGFPKSLDIGKAIDKVRDDRADIRAVCRWLRARIDDHPSQTIRTLAATFGFDQRMVQHWAARDTDSQPAVPTWDQWAKLRELLGFGPEMDAEVWRLNGRKGTPGEAWGQREVLATIPNRWAGKGDVLEWSGQSPREEANITAPATDDAKRWDGWGTALKPSQEMWFLASKSAGHPGILEEISSHLERLESECSSHARLVERNSTPTRHASHGVSRDSVPGHAATRPGVDPGTPMGTGTAAGSCEATDTPLSGSMANTCWNIVSSWKSCLAALSTLTSTSTTSTTSRTTTDLRTLSSSLSRITAENMLESLSGRCGQPCLVEVVDNLFAACVLSLRATHALSVSDPATSETLTSQGPGEGPRGNAPGQEHWWLVRKPLQGTVAANVLAHGVGGLNIAGTRVGAGRWPANLVLTHSADCPEAGPCAGDCPVGELDGQSGELGNNTRPGHGRSVIKARPSTAAKGAERPRVMARTVSDTGGASRYYPVFRYQAKAPARERPRLADGTAWPTVKPLGLMRWLVRLITPPGGLVLDPFAGTGTTAEACALEGLSCVLIERDPVALELIRVRLDRMAA